MNTYSFRTSGKHASKVEAVSAADALRKALEAFPGERIVELHVGMTEEEAENARLMGNRQARMGYISYEIPAHEPLGPKVPVRRSPDPTIPMFDEEEIKRESAGARYKRDHA